MTSHNSPPPLPPQQPPPLPVVYVPPPVPLPGPIGWIMKFAGEVMAVVIFLISLVLIALCGWMVWSVLQWAFGSVK